MVDIIPETKEIKTPVGGQTLLVRSYLTGEDRRANRRLLIQLAEEQKQSSIDGIEASEDALLTQVVKAIDGSDENIVGRVLKMHAKDYDFVMEYVAEVVGGMSEKKNQTSDSSTPTTSTEER